MIELEKTPSEYGYCAIKSNPDYLTDNNLY